MPMMEVTEYEQMMLLGWRGMAQASKEETLDVVEETRYAQSMQTKFTQAQLAKKWGCSKKHVAEIMKEYHIEPIGKRGKEKEYDGHQAQEAKEAHDGKVITKDNLNWKMRVM